jgi:hypothetical protein
MMLEHFGLLLSCFVHERHHKDVKRYGRHRDNTTSYERGMIEEITLQQIHELDKIELSVTRLVNPRDDNDKVRRALLALFPTGTHLLSASTAVVDCVEVHSGDVVLLEDGRIGEVWFHGSVTGLLVSCVSVWAESSSSRYSKTMVKSDDPCVVSLVDIQTCLMSTVNTAGTRATVLIPPAFRD